MAEIVNLRRARKSRQKQQDQAVAAQNRIDYGRKRGEKQHTEQINDKSRHDWQQHQLDPSESE